MADKQQPRYQSYLLRCWQEWGEQPAVMTWRFSLEDTHTGQRRGYVNLEALIAALQTELAGKKRRKAK